jgi:hypothetical protein
MFQLIDFMKEPLNIKLCLCNGAEPQNGRSYGLGNLDRREYV